MAGYIGSKASVVSSGAERKTVITATSGQTSLTGLSYTPNHVHVFQNGVRLVDGTDYTATNGSSITLTVGASADDQIVVVSYATYQNADSYTKAEADARFIEGDDTLYVDQTNDRVGVGTSSPTSRLEIRDETDISMNASGTGHLEIDGNGYNFAIALNSSGANLYTNSASRDLIFGTNETERMRIDSAGRVTMPYQPSFRVKGGSSGWVSVGTNTNTTVAWNTTLHNIGSHFSSNVFTAPVAGRYIFNQSIYARLNSGHGDNTNYWRSSFAVNGSVVESTSIVGYKNDGDYDNAYTATTILNLSASDYVSIIMRGSGVQADYYSNNCYFSGHLLG